MKSDGTFAAGAPMRSSAREDADADAAAAAAAREVEPPQRTDGSNRPVASAGEKVKQHKQPFSKRQIFFFPSPLSLSLSFEHF